jgi:hypothetical protein
MSIFRGELTRKLEMKRMAVFPGMLFQTGLLGAGIPDCCRGQAPKDKPVGVKSNDGLKKFEEAIAPYVKQARETLPEAKKR